MPTPAVEHTEDVVISQADFHALLRDKVRAAVQVVLNAVLDAEVEPSLARHPMRARRAARIIGTAVTRAGW